MPEPSSGQTSDYIPLTLYFLTARFVGTHLGQWGAGTGTLCGHGQHGGDAEAHSRRRGIHVDPEGHPWQNDNQKTGDVHLNEVIAHLALQMEASLNAGELSYGAEHTSMLSLSTGRGWRASFWSNVKRFLYSGSKDQPIQKPPRDRGQFLFLFFLFVSFVFCLVGGNTFNVPTHTQTYKHTYTHTKKKEKERKTQRGEHKTQWVIWKEGECSIVIDLYREIHSRAVQVRFIYIKIRIRLCSPRQKEKQMKNRKKYSL